MTKSYFPDPEEPADDDVFMIGALRNGKVIGLVSFSVPMEDTPGYLSGIASTEKGAGRATLCCVMQLVDFSFHVKPATQASAWWEAMAKIYQAEDLDIHGTTVWHFTPNKSK